MVHQIHHNGKLFSIIIKHNHNSNGIEFFTPDNFSQQLAYMKHPKGYAIEPHIHKIISREIKFTREVLYIKSGKIQIDFYDEDQQYLESKILESGDVILLADGGHGINMLEESEIIEIKQGPYAGDSDKIRFSPTTPPSGTVE